MKKPMKWMTGILLFLCTAGYFIYSSIKPLEVEWIPIEPQTVSQTFKEEGMVVSATEWPVHSRINGQLKRLPVKEGDQVKKGDILAEIEAKDLEYELQQLKAQKKSLIGQEKMKNQEIQQQLGQLQGQLESIQGQERQANKDPYTSQIIIQQLSIEDIKHQLETKKEEYFKIKTLYERGAVSKQEFDQALLTVNQLENNLQQQEQTLNLIKEQAAPLPGTDQYYSGLKQSVQTQIQALEKSGTQQYYQGLMESLDAQISHLEFQLANGKIISPIQGLVKEIKSKEGAVVSTQTPFLTLISPHDLELEVYLLTEDVIEVKEGMRVQLIQKRKNKEETFAGTVKAIAPVAEEKISSLGLTEQKVKVTIQPDEKGPVLRSGYALDVLFTTLEQHKKLAVPKSCLFPYEDGDAVWVIREGKATIQPVQKGMETAELAVIDKGLNAGDRVIKNPQLEGLVQGKRIK